MAKKLRKNDGEDKSQTPVYGNPDYSAGEDIYAREKKVGIRDSDEDDKPLRVGENKLKTGEDLDVPGSELDDADEEIGEEDEENNYYSLGGDDHDDLEEDKGE